MPALTSARTFPNIDGRDIIRELPGVYGFLRYRWGDLTPRIDVLDDMFVVHCDGLGGDDFDWKPLDYALVAIQRKELSISKRISN
jgi:hypothetical protein